MDTKTRVTPEQLKESAIAHGITRWIIHHCGFCNYPCGFYFFEDGVAYDNGCDCYYDPMRPSDWREVAAHFNLQIGHASFDEARAFWHLDDQPKG